MSGIFSGGDELGSSVDPIPIIIFDAVAATATTTLALVLGPALFSPYVKRSKAWLSMITTMMIFPLLYLLNAGSQFRTDAAPPIGICILQAGFIYAGPPAGTASVLCFMADMTLGLRAMLSNKPRNNLLARILIVLPSIIFASVFFEAIALVNGDRGVHFDSAHMFCESDNAGPQNKISAVLTVIALALTLCMQVWIVVMLYRNWSAVRTFRRTRTDFQLGVMVRLGVFTLVAGFAAVLGAVALPNNMHGGATWNIFLVLVPLLAAFAFGTRRDILSVYAFWNWRGRNRFRATGPSTVKIEVMVQSNAV